jgi:hypothetical protein
MRSKILILVLFVSSYCFSQSINDFVAVIVPTKFDFVRSENQYRLNTLTKFNLQKAGFLAFYTNENIPKEYNCRCSFLYADVKEEKGFLVTKLYVTFKDCYGTVIYKSEVGKSKEKEYELAYPEALNNAFESIYALHYKYNSKAVVNNQKTAGASTETLLVAGTTTVATAVAVNVPNNTDSNEVNLLFAQPIKNGFQLVYNSPKVVMKVFKTTNATIYLATKGTVQGALISKDNQWFFEYYEKDTLMSEKIAVKF